MLISQIPLSHMAEFESCDLIPGDLMYVLCAINSQVCVLNSIKDMQHKEYCSITQHNEKPRALNTCNNAIHIVNQLINYGDQAINKVIYHTIHTTRILITGTILRLIHVIL